MSGQAEEQFFRARIEPVLRERCFGCHSAAAPKIQGGLRLDARDGWLRGGDSGPAIVPGDSKNSLLVQALRHEGLEMPPDQPRLPQSVIDDFARWVDHGAADPRSEPLPPLETYDWNEARRFWSFQPVRRAPLPDVQDSGWIETWIDRYILAKLEHERLGPAPDADRRQLIRRLSFDLLGLPPTPEEVRAFENDPSPDAYERLVDRMLASPHYGERWAQHWLDVVRFAESEGFEYDRHLPDAWRYRDYVVQAWNGDKPYDQFVAEQVAGDELEQAGLDALAAAILHRLGPVRRNAGNPEIALSRNEVLTERTDILGAAFLGLTIGCARCHDHKLDPIPQEDYYRLQAYVAATQEHDVILATGDEQREWNEQAQPLRERIKRLRSESEHASPERKQQISEEIERLEEQLPPPLPTIPTVRDEPRERTEIHVLRRGVWENKGKSVGPRPPTVLVPPALPELPPDVVRPRWELARWLTDPRNLLVARVLVNRLWQHHFGDGLVRTPNDFGTHGDRPSHPELLDALADELIRGGWQIKRLQRLIVLSHAYRQSTESPYAASAAARDPENRWLWHFRRRRLSAEEIRDAMLAVSGQLNRQLAGPSVMVPVPKELVELLYKPAQWAVTRDANQHRRRSLYLIAKRNLRLPLMEVFDQPTTLTSCPRRDTTTHARQALELLNGEFAHGMALAFAARLQREAAGTGNADLREDAIIDRAYELAFGRSPIGRERAVARAFLRNNPIEEFALAILNLNEFLYVD